MYIRETFGTRIEERIEPVVKVSDRRQATVLNELSQLVVTPQWEKHLHRMLDDYTEAFEREEGEIGIWISGFFGSGKSLLMKTLGILLRGGEVGGQDVHQVFLDRLLAGSRDRQDIVHFLERCRRKISTSLVGGNLHALMASSQDSLALIAFKFFAEERGYTQSWAFAWAIEYQIDNRGLTEKFRQRASELSGIEWEEITLDPDFYGEDLNQAAAEVLSEHFSGPGAVQQAVQQAFQTGVAPKPLVERLKRWCENQDHEGRLHKVLLQLDELGQWLQSGTNSTQRAMEVQALVETASTFGGGRVWIAVTAHGDVQALSENIQQELYAKINQRFDIQCKLTNEDIGRVVRDRLLHKTAVASSLLRERFLERCGEITDLGSLEKTRRVYRTPTEENFADFYPYLPWMIDTIPNIVKGIAQAANRSEALTGSNRTMIGVVQGGIIDTSGLLDRPVGSLISLADLYDLLSSDAPSETKTDIARILDQAGNASDFTTRVARALYLLNQDEYIQSNLHNLTLALVTGLDYDLNSERSRVKNELDRLIAAGYVKQVGEIFIFLSTQQRTFQDKVRRREQQWSQKNYDLSQQLKFFEKDDALRFDKVPVQSQSGREKLVKVELDWGIVYNQNESVRVRVFTPLQYYLDRDLEDDATMRQKSNQEPNTFFFRLGQSKNLHRALARFVATREAVDEVLSSPAGNDPEKRVALQAREKDLPVYERDVRYYLGQAVEEGKIFLRGSAYDLADGDNPQEMVRNTLKHFLFGTIYTLFQNVPQHISNETAAVKAALSGNTTHPDLVALKVHNSDGTLNESSALISTLKGMLPLDEEGRGTISAEELRQRVEQPPYGWDGHVVRIGLALLLRVSQCRLQENSAYLSDPQNPDVAEVLTKASRFKVLRVQGVRSDLKGPELQEIRGYIQDVFGLSKLSVAAPTLNNVLDEQFKSLQEQARLLKEWAATAVCPLPAGFGAGHDLVAEMLNETAAGVRLPHFKREWGAVAAYRQLLQELTGFKNEQGQLYIQIREFFSRMSYIEEAPDAVKTFLADWRVLRDEQAITQASRWNDLLAAYRASSQAHAEQTASMVQEIREGEARLQAELVAQLASAALPAESLAAEQANLEQITGLQRLQADLAQSVIGYAEARRLRGELAKARVNLPIHIREVRQRYQLQPTAQPPGARPEATRPEIHMAWHTLLGENLRISSLSDLEQILHELRRRVENELADGHIVILD